MSARKVRSKTRGIPMRVESYRELRTLSDDELRDRFDQEARRVHVGLGFLRDELNRREQARQTRTITRLTWAIVGMTFVITIATLINVWVSFR